MSASTDTHFERPGMVQRSLAFALLATLAQICGGIPSAMGFEAAAGTTQAIRDPDTDGDGLSDFEEVHKYGTDPHRRDTAGSGASDGDWRRRREFNYSVRAIVRVMPPYNPQTFNDDYQDVRVREETDDYIELEVVVYPLNTVAETLRGAANWKQDNAGMKEYLAPGPTTNWDNPMRDELLRALRQDGVFPEQLTDKEVVEQVTRWLFRRSNHRSMFCTFYVGFRDGRAELLPGSERAFERDKGDPAWNAGEQFAHELFGREMFAKRCYGTCTSTAIYQTTVLRALGIPTRMILCIPLADASDPEQVEMVERGLKNHRVRWAVTQAALATGNSFSSHTFCEVFVGGRWRRLNYTELAQNALDPNYLGLMIKVHTFNDLSEARLGETWGMRYAKGERGPVFRHSNPYRLVEVSDHFGKHASIPNPPAEKELKRVTITKAYWPNGDAPQEIQGLARQLSGRGPGARDRSFYIHCQEWLDDAGGYLQYKRFMKQADSEFVLRAEGHPEVPCHISMNYYTHRSSGLCELEMVVLGAEYANMASGVAYAIHPRNRQGEFSWIVGEGVTLTRER